MPPNWHTASRARPRRCADTISPTASGRGGTGWSATSTTTPGRSLFVRLQESAKGSAGKWTDAATGEHGDLLDIIRESRGLRDFREVAEEARRFLKLPRLEQQLAPTPIRSLAPAGSQEAARRLFAMSSPIEGTVVETYLQRRGIAHVHHGGSLRFHPRCYYRPDDHLPTETWPAMIACVTDLDGRITGVHRTWLDPDGFDRVRLGKAPIDTPRRAMGDLLGNAVRFGVADDVLAAGEGIETMLSLRCVLPTLPMAAALSANHLSAMLLPSEPAPALYRPRRRCCRRCGAGGSDAARGSRRHRSDRVVASAGRLQRRSAHLRSRRPPGSVADSARTGGRRPLPASSTATVRNRPRWFDRRRQVGRGEAQCRKRTRPRPSRGRSDGKRPGPAMAAPGYFPPRAGDEKTH